MFSTFLFVGSVEVFKRQAIKCRSETLLATTCSIFHKQQLTLFLYVLQYELLDRDREDIKRLGQHLNGGECR